MYKKGAIAPVDVLSTGTMAPFYKRKREDPY